MNTPVKHKPNDYHHMRAWLEVLNTAWPTRERYLKEASEKGAPIESVYEAWEDNEDGVLVSVGWVQYGDLRSQYMTEEITKLFKKIGWGKP